MLLVVGVVLPFLSSRSRPGTFPVCCWSAGRRASGSRHQGPRLLPVAQGPRSVSQPGKSAGPSTWETGPLLQAPCGLGPRSPHSKYQGPLSSHQSSLRAGPTCPAEHSTFSASLLVFSGSPELIFSLPCPRAERDGVTQLEGSVCAFPVTSSVWA